MAAPYGYEPGTGLPYSEKSKLVAGLLQIFLGGLGIGRFYKGDIGIGVAQLLVTLVTLGFGAIWPLIDGIIMLCTRQTDSEGRPMRS
ncbi:TM2 domain-containing protein [Aestuariimicrobium ganziense]|uniref:TM2 domain-containing protein n=1 Tax=Aestuariimicrobium ganziense TaxID=2773677 RepID=UPI0019452D09|nr:TM2 domain-containing protein [Aestuariimicrobium ganziense]